MSFSIHADDLGMDATIDEGADRAARLGILDGVSVLATGPSLRHAVAVCACHPRLSVSLHIDLTEFGPVLPPDRVPDLVDARGRFRHTFSTLAVALMSDRGGFARQVSAEIESQYARLDLALGGHRIVGVDGHRHVHLLPRLWELVLALHHARPFKRIRIAREPRFAPGGAPDRGLADAGIGVLRASVLTLLSQRASPSARAAGLEYFGWFVGARHSGAMTLERVRTAIAALDARERARGVEVLFHPAVGAAAEAWRQREGEVLTSPEFARWLGQVRGPGARDA